MQPNIDSERVVGTNDERTPASRTPDLSEADRGRFRKGRDLRIECHQSVQPEQWDSLAESFAGSYFHCHGYAKFASRKSGVEPLFVQAFDRVGRCVGVVIALIETPRYWPFSRFCRTATVGALPATRDGDALLEQAIMVLLEQKLRFRGVYLIRILSRESPNSDEVLAALSYQKTVRSEFYVDLSASIEDIWKRLKGARRTDVRKASKAGVKTRVVNSPEGLTALRSLQAQSMHRRGLTTVEDRQVHKWQLDLIDQGNAMLLVSYADDKPVNAGLFTLFGTRVYHTQSGSSSDGNRLCGPTHLLWTMIETAKANGYTSLNLGGVTGPADGSGSEAGLFRFKAAFGAYAIHQPAGTKRLSNLGGLLAGSLVILRRLIRRRTGRPHRPT